jgi:hypothetical protein
MVIFTGRERPKSFEAEWQNYLDKVKAGPFKDIEILHSITTTAMPRKQTKLPWHESCENVRPKYQASKLVAYPTIYKSCQCNRLPVLV